jgi:hypothetical protein
MIKYVLHIVCVLVISSHLNSQIYNLIYGKVENFKWVHDTLASEQSSLFTDYYFQEDYLSAIKNLDSLLKSGKNNLPLSFNKALCYSKLGESDSSIRYITMYLANPVDQLSLGLIENSVMRDIVQSNKELSEQYLAKKDTFCTNLTNCDFALLIQYIDGREQEILMDTRFMDHQNEALKCSLLRQNSDLITKGLKRNKLPDRTEIGSTYDYLSLIILHMDCNPKLQKKLAKQFLKNEIKHKENTGRAAYALDRSLRNLNKKQKYGSIIDHRTDEQMSLYNYRGSVKALNRRRKKIGLVPIEVEMKTVVINKKING